MSVVSGGVGKAYRSSVPINVDVMYGAAYWWPEKAAAIDGKVQIELGEN